MNYNHLALLTVLSILQQQQNVDAEMQAYNHVIESLLLSKHYYNFLCHDFSYQEIQGSQLSLTFTVN